MNLLAQVKWQHETQSTRNGDVESWEVEKDEFFAAIFMGHGCDEGEPGRPYF
jgi:hypothetical protein